MLNSISVSVQMTSRGFKLSLIRLDTKLTTGQDAKVLEVPSKDMEDVNSTKAMERRFV